MTEREHQSLQQSSENRSELYKPLKAPAAEIRLLYTNPFDTDDSTVRCNLRTVSMVDDAHPQSAALSYTWGDPSVNSRIVITANSPVLKADKSLVGPLWIDASCIDQGNNEERSQQVQIMGKIYATASVVIAWLGEMLPQHVAGTEALDQFDHALKTKMNHEDYSWLKEKTWLWQWDWQKKKQPNAALVSIAQLLDLPYWTRIWVIQETIVCRTALAMLGDKLLPFSAFSSFLDFCKAVFGSLKHSQPLPLLHIYAQFLELSIKLSSLSNLSAARSEFEAKEPMPLQRLLPRFRHRLATDPRDRIFGMLGMADTSMKADYSRSTVDIFQELALMWTDKASASPLDFLLYSGSSETRPDNSWPSWLPDWHAPKPSVNFFPWSIFNGNRDPGPLTKTMLQSPFTVEQRRLRVSGAVIELIVATDRAKYGKAYGDMRRDLLRLFEQTIENHSQRYLLPLMRCLLWGEVAQDDNCMLEHFIDMRQHLHTFARLRGVEILPELEEAMLKGVAGKTNRVDFGLVVELLFWRCSICLTSKGRLATAAPDAQVGDVIVFMPGCSCPILLRGVES